MLNYLRRYSRSWIIALVIGAIAIVFVFTFGYGGRKSGGMGEVATVNGEPIGRDAYQQQFYNMLRQYQEQSQSELTEEMVKALRLKEMALQRLIGEALTLQAAERLGLKVSDAELRDEIQRLPYFQRGGGFDEQIYDIVLSRNRLTRDIFEAQERRRLQMRKMFEDLTSLAKVSDAELLDMYHLSKDAVQVSYLAFGPDKFLAKQNPSAADLSRYYQEHQAAFRLPARARVSYLYFRVQDFLEQAKVSSPEVEAFIQEHPAEFSRPKVILVRQIWLPRPPKAEAAKNQKESVEKQAQELLGKLQGGADFAQLAQIQSQDPASRDKGGDLGEVVRGQHPPEWDRVAFGLPAGQVARADTPQGIYLLKVEEIKETEKVPEAEAKVSALLRERRARTLAQEAAREARSALFQETVAEMIAKKYKVKAGETPWLAPGDQVPGLGELPTFNQTALQLKPGK